MMSTTRLFIERDELVFRLNITEADVTGWLDEETISAGGPMIPHIRIGKRVRFHLPTVIDWLTENFGRGYPDRTESAEVRGQRSEVKTQHGGGSM
jgi:hypothetical protein